MKKYIITVIITLSICLIIGIGIAIYFYNTKNVSNNIEEIKYKKIGNNLYYTEVLIEQKGRDKKKILKYLKTISDYLNKDFPTTEVYISNLNYHDLDNSVFFNGYQMINKVIIKDSFFTLVIKDNIINIIVEGISFNNNFKNGEIDTQDIISSEEAKEKALNIAKEHLHEMGIKNENEIKGYLDLIYDKENGLYYKITMNYGSYVKINAKTGKTINTYFDNGIRY